MKIAIVCQPWEHMAHPKLGSVEIQIEGGSRRLVTAGDCDVTVYTRRTRGFPNREVRGGVVYRRFGILHGHRLVTPFESLLYPRPSMPIFASRFYYATFFGQVAAALRKQKPDVIHIHNFSQFLPLAKWACPSSKTVIHMHNEWLTQFDEGTVRKRLRHADAIVGCSEFVVQRVRDKYPEYSSRCSAVYNAVNTNEFRPSGEPARNKRILYVGRISPEKGIHVLLDAFADVLKRVPDATLELVGSDLYQGRRMIVDLSDDPLTRELAQFGNSGYRQRIERHLTPEAAQRIQFRGPVAHSDLINFYRTAEMLVLPSVGHESFGIPAAEAAASGLPVIVARSGGLPEVIADGISGYVVDRADSAQLAQAIVQLLLDDGAKMSMGMEGRRRAIELFSWEASGQKLMDLYRGLRRESAKVQVPMASLERSPS
jgi:glycosyltransferase involved in cell wall biosynthesis